MTRQAVYHYLCYHVTLKNMRVLIEFMAKHADNAEVMGQPMGPRTRACFAVLARGLKANAAP